MVYICYCQFGKEPKIALNAMSVENKINKKGLKQQILLKKKKYLKSPLEIGLMECDFPLVYNLSFG